MIKSHRNERALVINDYVKTWRKGSPQWTFPLERCKGPVLSFLWFQPLLSLSWKTVRVLAAPGVSCSLSLRRAVWVRDRALEAGARSGRFAAFSGAVFLSAIGMICTWPGLCEDWFRRWTYSIQPRLWPPSPAFTGHCTWVTRGLLMLVAV